MYSARSETIIPPASKLTRHSPIKAFVERVIGEEFTTISNHIDAAHRIGKDNVIINLTFNFNCPNHIENKEVQLNVYYKIIKDLENKGYKVKLDITKKSATLYVSWKVTIDNEKIERMEQKIKSVLINK